jgi:predicted transcriptional regulator of viral defense system
MVLEYNTGSHARGISESHRRLLSRLHRAFSGPFTVADVARECALSRPRAARLLAYWASRGWLSRVRRGSYITVPLQAASPSERKEEPWVVVATLFEPAYIGGWSACEHWGLTDQIFSDIVVYTSRRLRNRKQTIQGTTYLLKTVSPRRVFGLTTVWRGQTRVRVSNPSRTIADLLDDPTVGGGIKHVAEVVLEYFSGEHRDEHALTDYITRLGNRTIQKRLGYLLETLDIHAPGVVKFCEKNVSSAYSRFDPSVKARGPIVRRWNLEVNVRITEISSKG